MTTAREALATAHKNMSATEIAAHALELAGMLEMNDNLLRSVIQALDLALASANRGDIDHALIMVEELAAIQLPALPERLFDGSVPPSVSRAVEAPAVE